MWHKLVNTRYFQEAAIEFKKNGGRYTTAPRGSKDYFDYWELQKKRCREGYQVGDVWIPGRYYFFLNFCVIDKIPDTVALQVLEDARSKVTGKVSIVTADKILDFPRFSEMQYEWFRFKHIAWNGGEFMGIKSPGGKHLCCGKTRGAGFSFMEAADGVYNFNFIPGSKSYYFASTEGFLTKDGILNKVQPMLDWINLYSPAWRQNRQEKGVLMHQKASFIDQFGDKRGSNAEIMGVIVDDPNKTRGKRGKKIVFEEAGSFKKLKQALEISRGSVRAGGLYVGQISVFGTGGEEGPSIEGLQDVFDHPHQWDMLAFPNIWEEGTQSECGYFVPSYRANLEYFDADGNLDYNLSIKFDNEERAKLSESTDPRALDRRKAEYPQKPAEMFNRLSNNGFNIAEIDAQIKRVQTDSNIKGLLKYGNFMRGTTGKSLGGVTFMPGLKENCKPIEEYPHPQTADYDLSGCSTIAEPPYIDQAGKVPPGMYQIVFDAYYKDEAEDRTSLFDFRVFKLVNSIDSSSYNLPVAWFTGRPNRLNTCYEQLFMMAEYYNCSVQGEISGGGKGVMDYATQKRLLHRVEFEPEMLHNKEIASKQRNRSYLMNMTTDRKRLGMTYLEQWHMEERGVKENGDPIYTVHKIYDIGLLREMRKGGVNNSDRMSSCIIAMFMLKENVAKQVKAHKTKNSFYERALFSAQQSGAEEFTTSY